MGYRKVNDNNGNNEQATDNYLHEHLLLGIEFWIKHVRKWTKNPAVPSGVMFMLLVFENA